MNNMETVLDQEGSKKVIERALERCPDEVGEAVRSLTGSGGGVNTNGWAEIPTVADALASALEELVPNAKDFAEAGFALDTATAIRVRAGEGARRGGPFEWKQSGEIWDARGPTNTLWSVLPRGSGWGIIIADWDRPDWFCASREDAMRTAEEIDARPSFPERLGIEEPHPQGPFDDPL